MTCRIQEKIKGYNVSDLCKSVGISRTGYYKIINSEVMPAVDMAIKICKYLSVYIGIQFTVEDFWSE